MKKRKNRRRKKRRERGQAERNAGCGKEGRREMNGSA